MTLGQYIVNYIQPSDIADHEYACFLNRIIVCFDSNHEHISQRQRTLTLNDLINIVIQTAIYQNKQHILALGYRFSRNELDNIHQSLSIANTTQSTIHGLEKWYPKSLLSNTSTSWTTDLKYWEYTYYQLGDDAMFRLLYASCIFAIIPNKVNTTYQLSGMPIYELKRFKTLEPSPCVETSMTIDKKEMLYTNRNESSSICPLKRFHRHDPILLYEFIFNDQDKKKIFYPWIKRILNRAIQCHYSSIFERYCPNNMKSQSNTIASPYHSIFLFVRKILKCLLPRDFLRFNQEKILWNVLKMFLIQNKSETFHDLGLIFEWQGFKASETGIVSQQKIDSKQYHVIFNLFKIFFVWLFHQFIIPLLADRFYITETTRNKNQLVYIRHDIWIMLIREHYRNSAKIFTKVQFTAIKTFDVLSSKEHGISKFPVLRLIPKDKPGEFRQVVNLCKASNKLRNLHHILSFERKESITNSIVKTASVMSFMEIHQRLLNYLNRIHINEHKGPFYMVSVDIAGCFDSIPHNLLLQSIKKIIKSDSYTCIKYVNLHKSMGEIRRKFIKKVKRGIHFTSDACADFEGIGVFTDQIIHDHEYRHEMIRILETHINQHFVQFPNTVNEESKSNKTVIYHQKMGIPQGSILSSLLCSIFYDNMDLEYLLEWILDNDVLLLRYTDDFLCISTDMIKTYKFLEYMKQGIPQFNCFINPNKIRTSFLSEDDSDLFQWCGLWLDKKCLNIRSNDDCLHEIIHPSSVTVYYGRHPYQILIQRSKYYLKSRLHHIYLDEKLNSWNTIIKNLSNSLELYAIRVRIYLRKLFRATKRVIDANFVILLRDQLIFYILYIARSKRLDIPVKRIIKLGEDAFHKHCTSRIKKHFI